MNEFEWEKFLKESDKRTDKFQELFEKYIDHPDRDQIIAREMGWEGMEKAESDEKECFEAPQDDEIDGSTVLEPNPMTEGVDWVRDESGHVHHPLTLDIINASSRMWHECEKQGSLSTTEVHQMISAFQITGAKVAGALDSLGYEDERDGGFIVACLKRALTYLHQAIDAAGKVRDKKLLSEEVLDEYQKTLFEVRERILNLMNDFRRKCP